MEVDDNTTPADYSNGNSVTADSNNNNNNAESLQKSAFLPNKKKMINNQLPKN